MRKYEVRPARETTRNETSLEIFQNELAKNMSDEAREPAIARARSARERLDVLLVARGLAPSRERARALIMAGEVRVAGQPATKAGTLVPTDAAIELAASASETRFVSRGGLKLERALDAFHLDPTGCSCVDVGASTGGFTDLLLQRGAAHVYAVDVGHGQLAWTLRNDPRVTVLERTNIRHLAALPELVGCAVIDVSFISLRLVLPRVLTLLTPEGWAVALVKPQFEAGRAEADRGAGVIREPAVHQRVLRELLAWLADEAPDVDGRRLRACGLIASPITGRDGNHEYLLLLRMSTAQGCVPVDEHTVEQAIHEAFAAAHHSVARPANT
ncbi:MAG TPA: TlyA family RNA methyltransferase [Ktedonobacterales bacterium]|nr:TlyA family RNA methyltransferase [Ktedonobacterales bacterium]